MRSLPEITVTKDRQFTLPPTFWSDEDIAPGMTFSIEKNYDGGFTATPVLKKPLIKKTRSIKDLQGILKTDKHLTLEEMDNAIAEALYEEDQRIRKGEE